MVYSEKSIQPSCKVHFVWPGTASPEYINFLPLGIGYLASNLAPHHEKRIFDGVIAGYDSSALLESIRVFSPQLVVISVWSFNVAASTEAGALISKHFPQIPIIVGGPEPSGRGPSMLEEFTWATYSFVAEGESSLNMLADIIALDAVTTESIMQIPGLVYRMKSDIHFNSPQYESLQELQPCDYEFIEFEAYLKKGYTYGMHRGAISSAPVLTTRGCPYNCFFCSARKINGRTVRTRPIDGVLREIRHLHERYGVRAINIIDDNFTFHMEYAKDFCRALIQENDLNLSINCPNGVRMERLDAELLELMRRAGWEWVFIAPESGSERTLASMNKSIGKEQIQAVVDLIHQAKLHAFGFFIIGYPGETVRDILATILFAMRTPFDAAVFTCFHPLPGTPIYDEISQSTHHAPEKTTDYYRINYAPEGMSVFQLKCLRLLAILFFNISKPRRIVLQLRYKKLRDVVRFIRRLL